MENLYNYVFWFNPYTNTWYAIETKDYNAFMSGYLVDKEEVLKSSKVETLIEVIAKQKNK